MNQPPPLPYPLPVTDYVVCLDAADQPTGYVGDWPEAGRVYAGRVKPVPGSDAQNVHLDGFCPDPAWGAFAARRFVLLARVWLN